MDAKKLLLVDDDPHMILLVKDYLEFRGYEVLTAENGRDALERLESFLPDMIICDVMMPEMDGHAFVEKVREDDRLSWVPILFLSAKGQSQDRVKGLKKGADVYMVKPFEPEELVAQVESSLRHTQRISTQRAAPYQESGAPLPPIRLAKRVVLTPTETKVVNLVAQGLKNQEIAVRLKVSQRTIESHVSNMLAKTGLNNRTELARWAMDNRMT
ncbi:MAG: response regulator transcription factor [Prochlorotrichaceae cyanobacterium]|jgi:DNA-binding NarL/FixJ family response regulator